MRRAILLPTPLLVFLAACDGGGNPPALAEAPGAALAGSSDEFGDPATLPDGSRVHEVEQRGFDLLESFGSGESRPGGFGAG